nr:reverse transcriptase domain-containing protein [Tanacetum cinerariifolium]GEZ10435.1 reverse transcriptase domain-containing protein [Tanacetum cinerariifolium]
MPPRRNMNINDVYERIIERMEERLDHFVDKFANQMNDMMNPRRRGDRNDRRNEGEESENPFFEGDGYLCFPNLRNGKVMVWLMTIMKKPPYLMMINMKKRFVVLGVMPFYDTDIEVVIEEEEGFVEKGGFGEEEEGFVKKGGFGRKEDNIKDIVVVANDLCSSMIQTTLGVDFEEGINTKSHELMSFGKKYYYQG